MIGLVALLITWALLRLEGRGLGAIGLNAPRRRARELALGLFAAGIVVAVQQLALSAATEVGWRQNPELTLGQALRVARSIVNSVLYEEFLFRGYLLYQCVRRLGDRRGALLGAAAFGVYHWFSYGVLGQPVAMAFVFALTGSFGLLLCAAFVRTRSIAAPIGLHLGWNLVAYLGFSEGPFGPGVWIPADGSSDLRASGAAWLALRLALPLAFALGGALLLLRAGRAPRAAD